jgi:hypothetical protein
MLTRNLKEIPMRDRSRRMIVSAAAIALLAACGTSGGTDTSGTQGRGGSSTTGPTGTGGGGTAGASTGSGGGGGASASGGTAGNGGNGATTGTGGTINTGGAAGVGGSSGNAGTGGAGGMTDGGVTDARGSNDASARDVADARASSDVSDAGATDTGARDVSLPDVNGGDGGPAPYKGVANSPCTEMAALGATWFYNWGTGRGNCTAPPFIPMIWGHTPPKGDEQTPAGITSSINNLVSQGYTTVLGFNEPDNSGQSNMTVATAISLWPSFTHPALRIGSPATSANAAGQMWFADFMSQVNADTTGTLRVDFIAAHWYGWNAGSCEANASSLEGYIKTIEMIPGNRPIWLTEWGCMHESNPDSPTVVAFFKGAVAMFAKHPRIERYAWYPWNPYNELFVDGGISPMGTAFGAAPQYK